MISLLIFLPRAIRTRPSAFWDLALQSFERAAWIKHVLLKADAPDFAGYLSERMNSDL